MRKVRFSKVASVLLFACLLPTLAYATTTVYFRDPETGQAYRCTAQRDSQGNITSLIDCIQVDSIPPVE